MPRSNVIVTATGFVALAGAVVGTWVLPSRLLVSAATAAPAADDSYELRAIVYDFKQAHADFNVEPAGGWGHYAGNVAPDLVNSRPRFIGLGADEHAEIAAIPTFSGPLGYDTALPGRQSDMREEQIATRVTLPAPVVVHSITAYVGEKEEDVRYAIYADGGGKPGALIAETGKEKSNDFMEWLTLPLSNVFIPAGDYWVALSFSHDDQEYSYASTGGLTHVVDHKAVDDGFKSNWGTSSSTSTRRVSIYADTSDASSFGTFGYNTAFSTLVDDVKEQQIATRVTMAEAGTLLSVTAYVGLKDKDVRFAVYDDAGGTPGMLLSESAAEQSSNSMGWMTIAVSDTAVPAGDYWLALAFEDNDHNMAVQTTGGTTRYKSGVDAVDDGFRSSWGSSTSATAEQIAIYATYTTDDSPVSYPGYKVTTQWEDAQLRTIAPQLFGRGTDDSIDFDVDGQTVVPNEDFVVELRVLGAGIQSGSSGYHIPITMRLFADGTVFEPFGPYGNAVFGNLNDNQVATCNNNGVNPRCTVLPGTFSPGTEVRVDARSWRLEGSDGCVASSWEQSMAASTADDTIQLEVLRNGDPVPQISALYQQNSIEEYVGDFIDFETQTMRLAENQVIYLWELGTSGSSSSADFQDLVLLVTLARSATGLCGALETGSGSGGTLCGDTLADTAGDATPAGEIDASGGIYSADSFSHWFNAVMGRNMTVLHPLTMVDDGAGVFEYLDGGFYPIDGKGFGNEEELHNDYFTLTFQADFTYSQCGGQFIEFEGGDDTWLFVNDELVMDLGGMQPGVSQYVAMDRLGLTDGAPVRVNFFHARRQNISNDFYLRTNIRLETSGEALLAHAFD